MDYNIMNNHVLTIYLRNRTLKLWICFLIPFASLPTVNYSFKFSIYYSHASLCRFMTWAIKIYNIAFSSLNTYINSTMPCISISLLNLILCLHIFPWWNLYLYFIHLSFFIIFLCINILHFTYSLMFMSFLVTINLHYCKYLCTFLCLCA